MKYAIKIGNDNNFHGVKEQEIEEGQKVCFYVPFVSDVSLHVSSEDVQIQNEPNDPYAYNFSFVMPNHDVTIAISFQSSMINRMPVQQDYIICKYCGSRVKKHNFCSECGNKIV